MSAAADTPTAVRARPPWRAVAVPSEHGGWGLTLEPALLGLLVAPGAAGAFLAGAALLAFLVRTPLKLVLVDAHRHRDLDRTRLARRVALVESVVLAALVVAAVLAADAPFWWPALVAAPFVTVELWFEMRSRGRRLVPELAGAVGIGAVVAMIVLADGKAASLAAALWMVLAARALTAIPSVRDQVMRLHGRSARASTVWLGDAAAIVVAAGAVLVDPVASAGAVAVVAVVALQHLSAHHPAPRAALLGARQSALGFLVVAVTALGVLAA